MKTLILILFLILPFYAMAEVKVVDPGPADFEDVDRNGDGQIDREEFRSRMIEVFYGMDGNRDGILTINEWGPMDEERARRCDKNGNGELSLEEFLLETYYDFDTVDQNDDGGLQERETARQ
jgi:hypothetical protein